MEFTTGVSLVVPIEVLNEENVRALAALAKRLLKRETTVADEFPGYVYGREEWLSEASLRVCIAAENGLFSHAKISRELATSSSVNRTNDRKKCPDPHARHLGQHQSEFVYRRTRGRLIKRKTKHVKPVANGKPR